MEQPHSTRNKAAWGINEVDLATLKERFDDYDAKLTTSHFSDSSSNNELDSPPRTFARVRSFRLILACILIFSAASLPAIGGDFWNIGIEASADLNYSYPGASGAMTDGEFIAGFDRRPLLNLDLSLWYGDWRFLTEATILSLRPALALDPDTIFSPMVKLAFAEYGNGFVYASAGRRKQSMGVSDYNLFVNRAMPFFDGFNLSFGRERGFRFDSLLSVANLTRYSYTNDYSKYFMYHVLSYTGATWFLMVGEAVTIANPAGLFDLNIFPNAHNEHSSHTNVGMELQYAMTFLDKSLLVYGMAALDDLPSGENDSSAEDLAAYPDALAWGAGLRWQVFPGEAFAYPASDPDREIRRNTAFGRGEAGGLSLSLDYAGASRWMYVRSKKYTRTDQFDGQGSFYNYFYLPEFIADEDQFAVPFGIPTGGDSHIISLKAVWETARWRAQARFDTALLGADARANAANTDYWGSADIGWTDPDADNYSLKWFTSGDVRPLFSIGGSFEYGFLSWLSAYGGFSMQFCDWAPFSFTLNAGATVKF